MKHFVFLLFLVIIFPIAVFAYTSPGKPQGFVSDFAQIIDAKDKVTMTEQLTTLRNSTSIEIAVVTVPTLDNEVVETYAVKLFEEWGIGVKGKDNGLLILVAPNDRQARIEVGYGLEGTITDIQAKNIVDQVMLPAFKLGNYSMGIKGSVDAVLGIINKSPEANQYLQSSKSSGNSSGFGFNFETLLFFIIFFSSILARFLSKTKSWWLGGVIGAVIGAVIGLIWGFLYYGIGAIILLSIFGLILDYIVSKKGPGGFDGHGGFWFGGGHGGGSGGFGGFGGGMSGGGGASGRW